MGGGGEFVEEKEDEDVAPGLAASRTLVSLGTSCSDGNVPQLHCLIQP